MTKEVARRSNATIENQAIAAEIRTQLLNEQLQLHKNLDAALKRLMDDAQQAREHFDDSDVERALAEGDATDVDRHLEDCLGIAQGDLSVLEQHLQQIVAAMVEFRIRKRTVEMVLRKFVGSAGAVSAENLRITDSNARTGLPAVRNR